MNTSSDAAEQVVKISLEGFQVIAKITGSGAKDIAALLYAIMKDKQKLTGKTKLANMLKSGKELKVFTVRQQDFKSFTEEAKRYGVLYCSINKKDKVNDGVVDIMVRAEDAAKINRIIDRFKMSSYDETVIRGEIEKSKENNSNTEKSNNLSNPHGATTEKNPQSEPSLKTPRTSDLGTKMNNKPSVKDKLERAKQEVKMRESSKNKSEITPFPKKSKNKEIEK